MIKYRTRFDKIEEFEILRETEHCIISSDTVRGKRREKKESNYSNWHDSWGEAHEFLVSKAQSEVDSLRIRLQQANGRVGQLKGMKPKNKQ